MKISKLLVLSAAWLGMSSSAMADVPDGIWTAPDPSAHLTFTEFTDDGERYILFNPATKMFFASGNGWNTMASLRTFGMEMWLQESTEADAPEGSYELWNNNVNNPARTTGEGNVFTDDGNASWVDHGTQGNYSWGYTTVGGFVRFQNVALIADKPEFEGMYLGFDGTYVVTDVSANSGDNRNAYTAILRHVDPNAEGVSVDWLAVTPESYEQFVYDEDAYNAYVDGMKTYIASMGLKKAIKDAEALFIDVTNATAVYMNKESTATQMANSTASLNELITVKEKLQKAINEAKAKGFDGAASFEAVLQNTAATKADVEKAISDLNDAFVEWGKNQASVANPVDMSGKIVNATFDNGDCTTGWSGDAFGRGGAVSDGAEHYNKNYNTYQKISGLAAGIYAVGVNGYYRSGNYGGAAESHFLAKDEASKYAKFYATVGERNFETSIANVLSGAQAEIQNVGDVEVTYTDPETEETVTVYSPNTMVAGDHYMHVLGQYANKLFVIVDEAGELTIGVKKTSQVDGDWSMFDDFSLTYYGKGADACQFYLDETMKNYGDYSIDEGVLFTEAYLDAYKQACTGPKTASTIDEVYAVLDAVEGAKSAIDENIKLWKNYQKAIEKGKLMLVDSELQAIDEVGDLGDYIEIQYEEYVEALALTNEQLTTEIEKLESLMTTIETKSKMEVYDGKDMTKFIKNPGFDEDEDINSGAAEGWTIDKGTGQNIVRGPLGQGNQDLMKSVLGEGNFCFEAWHRYNWDVWQEVEDLPVGMYELQVQGYVRCEMGGYNPGDELEGEYASPVYLYMNNAMSSFPSVYSEQVADEHYVDGALPVVEGHSWNGALANYPNSMGAASLCFMWGMYKTTAYGLIAKEGDKFRIGVKMLSDKDWWCIWDNFKLIYRTPSAELVKPILEEELAKIDLSKPMGKNVFAQAEAVTKAAQEAIANNDGAAMFAALTDAYDLSAAIIASTALFDQLAKANENFYEAISGEKVKNDAAKKQAEDLYDEIANGIETHKYEDAEVEGLMNQMAVLRTKMVLPNGYDAATDDNQSDFTDAIQTPSFVNENEESSSTGWNNPGNLGNDDTQKSAGAIEFWQSAFDMNQTIVGLPEGTYIVAADAWCRVGASTENYEAWTADPKATLAYLYAVDGDSVVYSVPVANLMKGAQTEDPGWEDYGIALETISGTDYYLPNSLQGGRIYWDPDYIAANEGVYTNKVTAKVKADGKLTVGIKKATEKANSWVVCDDFKLFYCGTGSSLTPSDDASGIESIAKPVQVKVEYFTLDGRKATRLQKGLMIQKVTFENGATIVKKIRK